jgi:poly-gamma-glutamate synthesis protein (capsule biosynthesis protein)
MRSKLLTFLIIISLFVFAGAARAKTTVTVENRMVEVSLNLAFSFSEKVPQEDRKSLVSEWVGGMMAVWGGPDFSYGSCRYPVRFQISTEILPEGKTCLDAKKEMPSSHCVNVVSTPVNMRGNVADSSLVSPQSPNSYGEWTIHTSPIDAAHEMGYMMGLDGEYYRDEQGNWVAEGPEAENSIMAKAWSEAKAEQYHINKIVEAAGISCPASYAEGGIKNIIMVGDIMMNRGVKYFIDKNGSVLYPFEKFKDFSKDKDIVFGNLEGPIVTNYQISPQEEYRFAFAPDTVDALSFANFNLVSLANNHTLNMGREGFEETKEFLKEENIGFFGDSVYCDPADGWYTDDLIFLGFNKTFPFNCEDKEIARIIEDVSAGNPDKLLLVSFHWGNEYQETSSVLQQGLAHLAVDAGADLVIGQHPHVVQEIEEYRGKLIFYSLGNFLFDQFFSRETSQGLVVDAVLSRDYGIYKLFPFDLSRAQPTMMQGEDRTDFLDELAIRSDEAIASQIKEGTVIIDSQSTILNID